MNAPGAVGDVRQRMEEIEGRFRPPAGFHTALADAHARVRDEPVEAARPPEVTGPPRVDVETLRAVAAGGPPVAAASVGDWAARLPEAGRRWAPQIESAARAAGVEPALLAALVQHESGFRADARSDAGAVGLAQLMPATARGLGVDPEDPAQNLEGGARYLRAQLDRFGSPDLALAAYNAGPNRVAVAGGVPQIAETRAYVARVLSTYESLR